MARSNYSDQSTVQDQYMPPHGLPVNFGSRTYDPTAGADDGEGGSHSSLFEHSLGGDWSWQPRRDRSLKSGYDKDGVFFDQFVTFRGVPPSAAELYRGQVFSRA